MSGRAVCVAQARRQLVGARQSDVVQRQVRVFEVLQAVQVLCAMQQSQQVTDTKALTRHATGAPMRLITLFCRYTMRSSRQAWPSNSMCSMSWPCSATSCSVCVRRSTSATRSQLSAPPAWKRFPHCAPRACAAAPERLAASRASVVTRWQLPAMLESSHGTCARAASHDTRRYVERTRDSGEGGRGLQKKNSSEDGRRTTLLRQLHRLRVRGLLLHHHGVLLHRSRLHHHGVHHSWLRHHAWLLHGRLLHGHARGRHGERLREVDTQVFQLRVQGRGA